MNFNANGGWGAGAIHDEDRGSSKPGENSMTAWLRKNGPIQGLGAPVGNPRTVGPYMAQFGFPPSNPVTFPGWNGSPAGMLAPPATFGTHQFYPQQQMLPKMPTLVPMRDIGELTVEYFGMGKFLGRGGILRLYLLGKQVKHQFNWVVVDSDWSDKKVDYTDPASNPQGVLPVMHHAGVAMTETWAMLRFLAKKLGEYGGNGRNDFLADWIVEKLAVWRDELMCGIQEWHQTEGQSVGERYLTSRQDCYDVIETFLAANPGTGNAEKLTWCDFGMAANIADDLRLVESTNPDDEAFGPCLLESRPKMKAIYEAVMKLQLVDFWITKELQPASEEKSEESDDEKAKENAVSFPRESSEKESSIVSSASVNPFQHATGGPMMAWNESYYVPSYFLGHPGMPGLPGGGMRVPPQAMGCNQPYPPQFRNVGCGGPAPPATQMLPPMFAGPQPIRQSCMNAGYEYIQAGAQRWGGYPAFQGEGREG